jgi:serine/threonine protein phosphatase PrpC
MKQASIYELPTAELVFDQISPEVVTQRLASGTVAAFSHRCPQRLGRSEDSVALFSLDEHSGVLVVADGLGGLPAGELAARVAIEMLQSTLQIAQAEGTSLRAAILDGVEQANTAILELGVGAATTLAVIEIQGRMVRPYHVGDSMILAFGQRGRIKLQSVAHSPIGYAVEAGFLDATEAMHHADRHLISNMLGSPEMHITMGSPLELSPRDTVLVASDGLADNLHLEEIIATARKGALDQAAHELLTRGLQRMTSPEAGAPSKPDDLSAILFRPAF